MLGSANNNYRLTLHRVKHACWARRAFDLRARYPILYVRRQGASDEGRGEVDKVQAVEWWSRTIDGS